jgi:hypothetical protein
VRRRRVLGAHCLHPPGKRGPRQWASSRKYEGA